MEGQYNKRSPAVKRLMREAEELSVATSDYYAQPLEDNLFEWHFTVRGPSETDFQGGIYHGRIVLPTDYPMKPPNIIVLTPNGRFEVSKKICLSISGHHPESWQPSWSIRTALLAIIGFMPTPGQGTIGSLDYTPEERKVLARKSVQFKCDKCGAISNLLKDENESTTHEKNAEMEEIIRKMTFKSEDEVEMEKNNQKEEEDEDKIIKAASKAAQERFRQRLQLRTKGMSDPSNVPSLRRRTSTSQPQPPANTPRNNNQIGGRRSSVYDIIIAVLIAAIGAILYRRFNLCDSSD